MPDEPDANRTRDLPTLADLHNAARMAVHQGLQDAFAGKWYDEPVQLPLFDDPTVYAPTCDTEHPETCESCQ